MVNRISILVLLLALLLSTRVLHAQACCSAGTPLLSSLELSSTSAGTVQFALTYQYNALRDVLSGTVSLDDASRRRGAHSVLLETSYGITSSLSASVLLALVQQERRVVSPLTNSESFLRLRGLGDAVVLLKYTMIPVNLLSQYELTVGIGGKIPVGASGVVSEGILVPADMQPGTGAWDGIVWLYASKGFVPALPLTLFGTSSYRLTGTNARYGSHQDGYKFGNEFIATLGAGYRTDEPIDFSLVGRLRTVLPDRFGTGELPNTGGTWLSIVPGLNIKTTEYLTIRTTFEIPVYRKLIGTQLTTSFVGGVTVFYTM